jgi:SAM-dependent methyltransferase
MHSSVPEKKANELTWIQSQMGQDLQQLKCQHLAQLSDRLYGRFMLQLGVACPGAELPGVGKQVFLSDSALAGADVFAEFSSVPIATSSVNVVLLDHVLEFAKNPYRLLREMDRVLIPGGRLLIALYNPFSFFGMWRLFHAGQYPWNGWLRGQARVVEWLNVLGFELESRAYLGYRLPFQNQRLYRYSSYLETLGPRLWPRGAAVVMLVAVKLEIPTSVIRPRWTVKAAPGLIIGGAVEPRMRQKHHD